MTEPTWPYPRIVAHRCGGRLAPENTLAAVRCGLRYGFRAVEFDAMLAKDGVPVVMHDPTLGRTVAGGGRVSDYTSAQLAQMDAGAWFGPEQAGETVPLLETMIAFCQEHGIWMDIEIKPVPGFEAQTGQAVARLVQRMHRPGVSFATPAPILTSFSMEALQAARQEAPELARGYLTESIPADWQERLTRLESRILQTSHRKLTPDLAQAVKRAGVGLFCYTVNEPERARELLDWGVDAFCTDRLDLIGPDFR